MKSNIVSKQRAKLSKLIVSSQFSASCLKSTALPADANTTVLRADAESDKSDSDFSDKAKQASNLH